MDEKYKNINNQNPTKSTLKESLITPSNVKFNMGRCLKEDVSMNKLTRCQKNFIIILGIVLVIVCIYCIIITIIIRSESDHYIDNIYLGTEFLILAYGIFISVSVLRVNWIRITSALLSVIFEIIGFGWVMFELLVIDG